MPVLDSSSDDDDVPLAMRAQTAAATTAPPAEKPASVVGVVKPYVAPPIQSSSVPTAPAATASAFVQKPAVKAFGDDDALVKQPAAVAKTMAPAGVAASNGGANNNGSGFVIPKRPRADRARATTTCR